MLELNKIYNMDCLQGLKLLDDNSVDCCVTSPPYWGLRDYGVEGQIGLEKTPKEYVQHLVRVFREVKRVLKNDGTLWLNLGDSYSGSGKGAANYPGDYPKQNSNAGSLTVKGMVGHVPPGLKPKDLVGIPWMVAFALRNDGWYLRQDIIWNKPNPMPESVKDRCTKSHEYIFLLSKSRNYYYDAEAIKEPCKTHEDRPFGAVREREWGYNSKHLKARGFKKKSNENIIPSQKYLQHHGNDYNKFSFRNKRDVWTVATKPFLGAHFATFPPELINPCILAGCPIGGLVLDPFMGSGTTGMVALQNQRNFIGFELNSEYIKIAEEYRLRDIQLKIV
jgi:DNA modification methylase